MWKKNITQCTPSIILIGFIFGISTIISSLIKVPLSEITSNFNYSVIVILITMELFTNLVIETGIMQFLATKLAFLSNGNIKTCIYLFGGLMFFISAFLNNITAVMMILPVIFVMLKALDVNAKNIYIFFSIILALSNTGGAASPIGDFPAIVIMTSGIVSFEEYLFHAFPLFFVTSIIIIIFWNQFVHDSSNNKLEKKMAVDLLYSRYKNIKVDWKALMALGIIMLLMFISWSTIPQNIMPPEVIAILGYSIGIIVLSLKGLAIHQNMNMKSVLTISSFLFLATVVSSSGILEVMAKSLEYNISSPILLLVILMIVTSILSGLFSAGPAAAAIMPIIINICQTNFVGQSSWIAIAYASSICAGSSLFLWSATAGFILSNKIEEEKIQYSNKTITWGIPQYLKFGIVNYTIQMVVSILWITIVITTE